MSYLFFGCKNLSDISALSNWNTQNVTTMQGMFAGHIGDEYPTPTRVPGCVSLKKLNELKNWNTDNVTNMSYMFSGCTSIDSLQALANWKTSNVTNMDAMFAGVNRLKNVDEIADWKVSNVATMRGMFAGCTSLENLNGFKKWKTNKNLVISCMFDSCENLTDISGITDWNISVNPADGPLRYVFARCMKLTDISPIQSWADKFYEDSYYGSSSSEMFGYRTFEYPPITFTNIKWIKPNVLSDIFSSSEGAVFILNVGNTTDKEINDYFNNIQDYDNYAVGSGLSSNIIITDNDLLLKAMNGQKADGEKAHFVTVQYGNTSEKTYIPAVLDSRINGKDSKPSTDAVEIVKHYIPGAVAEGAKALRKNNAEVPTTYVAVAEKELPANAKLSDLFQTYTIKAAHKVTFMKGESTVTTLNVEAGKKIADLAGKTIVTNDAVLTDVTMPNAPVKDGYTFKEWNTKADGTGTVFTKDTPITSDITVYAIYTQNPSTPPTPLPILNPPTKPTPPTLPHDREHTPDNTNDHGNNNTPDNTPDNTNAPETSGDTPSNNTSNDNNDNGNDASKGANSGSASVGALGNGHAISPRTPSATNHGASGNTASGNTATGVTSTGSTNETSASNNSSTSNTDTAQNTTGATNTHNTSPAKNDANRTDNQRSDTWDALRIAMYCLLLLLLLLLIVLIAWIVKRLRERAQQSQ